MTEWVQILTVFLPTVFKLFLSVFEAPKVAVSDGSETILSCNLKGLYTTPANVTWNNGALPTTSVYNGNFIHFANLDPLFTAEMS